MPFGMLQKVLKRNRLAFDLASFRLPLARFQFFQISKRGTPLDAVFERTDKTATKPCGPLRRLASWVWWGVLDFKHAAWLSLALVAWLLGPDPPNVPD